MGRHALMNRFSYIPEIGRKMTFVFFRTATARRPAHSSTGTQRKARPTRQPSVGQTTRHVHTGHAHRTQPHTARRAGGGSLTFSQSQLAHFRHSASSHHGSHTQEARATRHDRRPDTIEYTTCSSPPPCVQANLFALRCVVAPEMHTSNVCARARPREPSRHPLSVCRGSSTTCSVACEHVVLPAQAGRRLRRGFHRSEDWPFAVVVVVGHRIVIQRASVGDLSVN